MLHPKLAGRSLRDLALKEISLEKGMLSPFTPGKGLSPLQTLSVAPKRGHTTSLLLYIPCDIPSDRGLPYAPYLAPFVGCAEKELNNTAIFKNHRFQRPETQVEV